MWDMMYSSYSIRGSSRSEVNAAAAAAAAAAVACSQGKSTKDQNSARTNMDANGHMPNCQSNLSMRIRGERTREAKEEGTTSESVGLPVNQWDSSTAGWSACSRVCVWLSCLVLFSSASSSSSSCVLLQQPRAHCKDKVQIVESPEWGTEHGNPGAKPRPPHRQRG